MAQGKRSSNYRNPGKTRDEAPTRFRDGQPVFDDEPGGKRPYSQKDGGRGTKTYNNRGQKSEGKPSYGNRRQNGESHSNEGQKPYNKRGEKSDSPYRSKEGRTYADKTPRPAAPVEAAPQAVVYREDELPYIIMGRNAVREAVKSGRSIDRILVVEELDGSLREVVSLARDRNIQIREVERCKLDVLCMPFGHGEKPGNHQGIVAQVPGVEYVDVGDLIEGAKAKNEKPFIILLDGIEDPHNLGSIIRSAVCAGAHGIVLPKRRSASVTAAACKASAGAVEYCPVARVSNISNAIERLKQEGLWIAGADMGGTPMQQAKLEGAIGLVIGGEGDGLSHLVKEKSDFLVSIPMYGEMDSLNAAVAAAVLMFEKRRQDGAQR